MLLSRSLLARIGLGENDHTRRVPMKKVVPSDWTNLALSKESRCWDGAEALLNDPAIMMGPSEEPLSTSATAKQKGPEWGTLVRRPIRSQEEMQVVACRLRIAEVKLDGLAFLNNVSDGNGAGLLIRSDKVPNEEVASLEMTPVLIDHDSQVHRTVGIVALGSSQRFEDVLEPFQGRDAAEFINEALFRPGNDKPFTDRTAALRGYGSHGNRSGELHPYHASVEDLIIEQ